MAASVTVGDLVRRYRRLRKLTQEALAERAQVDRSYLGKIEVGDVLEPGAETVKRLAVALGVTVRSLAEPLGWYDAEPTRDQLAEAERAILELPNLTDDEKQALIILMGRA